MPRKAAPQASVRDSNLELEAPTGTRRIQRSASDEEGTSGAQSERPSFRLFALASDLRLAQDGMMMESDLQADASDAEQKGEYAGLPDLDGELQQLVRTAALTVLLLWLAFAALMVVKGL